MKHYFSRLLITALTASPFFWGCTGEITDEKSKPVAPVVAQYFLGDAEIHDGDELEVVANAPVRLEAKMQTSGPVDCAWYVCPKDGEEEKIASTPAVTYQFPVAGVYTIRYSASNSEGETGATMIVTATGVPLTVEFEPSDDVINVNVLEKFSVTASVTGGDEDVVHSWKLNDETISTDAALTYTIPAPGNYTLTYEGRNKYNSTVTKTWTVNAADKPLYVEFSIPGQALTCTAGLPVRIKANVITGNVSVTHTWEIDGDKVSEEEMLNYTFETAGSHELTYKAVNGLDQSVTNTWNVTVDAYLEGTLINNFQDIQQIQHRGGNLSIVDNEWRTDIDDSEKILKVVGYTGNGIGLFNMGGGGLPGITLPASTRILRVKILMTTKTYYPILSWTASGSDRVYPTKINGQPFDVETMTEEDFQARLYDAVEWNVIEYSTPNIARNHIQLGPFCTDLKKSGEKDPLKSEPVYYDDFEYLTTEDIQ